MESVLYSVLLVKPNHMRRHIFCIALMCFSYSLQVFAGPGINPTGNTIGSRFNPPAGYTRVPVAAGSYGAYLRTLPLKPHGSPVLYFDGRIKPNPGIYTGVLRMDVGNEDLQQCADAIMRMRAEYLYGAGKGRAISFRLTNGFAVDYAHWQQGYRVSISGNKTAWVKAGPPSNDYASFRAYLRLVFSYAGTKSLAKELNPVPFREMQPGDVLIVGGSPGHAVTVMDMAQHPSGRKVYLLSQSYMPAQDIQILCNPASPDGSPWYELPPGSGIIRTPQWDFTTNDLKRFSD
jgi:hypothetical protein